MTEKKKRPDKCPECGGELKERFTLEELWTCKCGYYWLYDLEGEVTEGKK